jgi:hypothetical protein
MLLQWETTPWGGVSILFPSGAQKGNAPAMKKKEDNLYGFGAIFPRVTVGHGGLNERERQQRRELE